MQDNTSVINVHSTESALAVEICGKVASAFMRGESGPRGGQELRTTLVQPGERCSLKACSACAGDYEDPDRTAWEADNSDGPRDEGAREFNSEEFPAEK